MNISRAFATYLEAEGYGTFGDDLFIGGVPQGSPDASYWIVAEGGTSTIKNHTGEKLKAYTLSLYYRSTNALDVYDNLQALEEEINSAGCPDLEGFTTVDSEAILFHSDQDLDNEDRTIGLLQVSLTTYQE